MIKKIAIVGGGSAGWLSAAALAKNFEGQNVKIVLVESPDIPTIGVGEATIPPIINFLQFLGVTEKEFMLATDATYKLAIRFDDWLEKGRSYYHPFGSVGVKINQQDFYPFWLREKIAGTQGRITDYSMSAVMCEQNAFYHPSRAPQDSFLAGASYALHFDASRVADFLKRYAQARGVTHISANIGEVRCNEEGIQSVATDIGLDIDADFFIDCTGFKALLMEKALSVRYESWRSQLPCDRAVAMQVKPSENIHPYTISKAQDNGWSWEIPLQSRTGMGYVYSSAYCSDEEAIECLKSMANTEVLTEPRVIRFETGCREKHWFKNCLALGLSGGFIEPLESTAIHLVTRGLRAFLDLFPASEHMAPLAQEYNRIMRTEYESIRDFIVLHYCKTRRDDTPFWRDCQGMGIPKTLQQKIDLYEAQGALYFDSDELFKAPSWHCVFEGMGVSPRNVHSCVNTVAPADVVPVLEQVHQLMSQIASDLPKHEVYLSQFLGKKKAQRSLSAISTSE